MKTILLADDEPSLRLLVRTTLEDSSYRILEASDGNAALEMARQEHPDLIVLDWMMPGKSGPEVARALRDDPLTAGISIIMLTARDRPEDLEVGKAVGAMAYLTKPFSPLQLLRSVEEALGA